MKLILLVMASKSKLKKLIKLAEKGHADSQNKLGNIYFKGDGVDQSDVMAWKWYRKAAEQGNAHAQYNMGTIYERSNYTFCLVICNKCIF